MRVEPPALTLTGVSERNQRDFDNKCIYWKPLLIRMGPCFRPLPQPDPDRHTSTSGSTPPYSNLKGDPQIYSHLHPGPPQAYQSAAERRDELKQHMAVACGQLLAAPEEHVRNLRALLALTADSDGAVRRLAQLSLLAVLRDIMPGYRIRLPSEKELTMPVSKDVRKVRDYETTLLKLYQVRHPAKERELLGSGL